MCTRVRVPTSAFDPGKLRCEQKFWVVVNVRSLSVTKLSRSCRFWREGSPHDHGARSAWQSVTEPDGAYPDALFVAQEGSIRAGGMARTRTDHTVRACWISVGQ